LYTDNGRELHNLKRDGHPIMVECTVTSEGREVIATRCFNVGIVEFEPVFHATEVPVEKIGPVSSFCPDCVDTMSGLEDSQPCTHGKDGG
jgi:hypothetical protein